MNLLEPHSNQPHRNSINIPGLQDKLKQVWHTSLYSNAIYLMISSVTSSLLGFIFWIVAARLYSTEQVGLASAIIAAAGLMAMFATLGMDMGLLRFLSRAENPVVMINTVFTIGIITSTIVTFVFVAGLGFWSPALVFIRQNSLYLIAFIIVCIVNQINGLLSHALIANRRTGFVATGSLISNLLDLFLVILLAGFLQSSGIFTAWGISLVVSFLIGIFWFLPKVQPGYRPFFSVNRQVVNDMIGFSLANYLATFFWSAPGTILPLMVVNLLGAESNAYFYIAWSIGSTLPLIAGAVTTSLFAEGSKDEKTLEPNIWRSLKMSFIIILPPSILVIVLAPLLLHFFGKSYAGNGTSLLRIITLSSIPTVINITYISIKRVEKNLKALVIFTCIQGIASLLFAYLLMPPMGLNGIGIAWLSIQSALAVFVVIHLSRALQIIPKLKVFISHDKTPSG